MKEYIIFNIDGGYTENGKGDEVENCQVLGTVKARTPKAGWNKLNKELKLTAQGFASIEVREVIGKPEYF